MFHTSSAFLVILENVYVIFRDVVFQNGNFKQNNNKKSLKIRLGKRNMYMYIILYVKTRKWCNGLLQKF